MHPSILAQRRAGAMARIVEAARGLDPEHAEALEPKGIKDPQAADMMRLEALADILERLGTVVTAVTEVQNAAIETDADPHPVDEPADDSRPTLDDFPAHVVGPADEEEEAPASKKPARKKPARSKKS